MGAFVASITPCYVEVRAVLGREVCDASGRMDTFHLAPGGVVHHDTLRPQSRPDIGIRLESHETFSTPHISRAPSIMDETKERGRHHRRSRKIVLCFDGTGNKFHGDDSDSNILKIYRMLDRTAKDQCKFDIFKAPCSRPNRGCRPLLSAYVVLRKRESDDADHAKPESAPMSSLTA